jgi:hypothetical protein
MNEYEVGYRKPPKNSRFKPGRSGNPSGRPKRKRFPVADLIGEILKAPIVYHEHGRSRVTTRHELSLRILVARAASGDIGAAENLLKVRERAERFGDAGVNILTITDWMPDYEGQTAEQKTRDFNEAGHAQPQMPSDLAEEQ